PAGDGGPAEADRRGQAGRGADDAIERDAGVLAGAGREQGPAGARAERGQADRREDCVADAVAQIDRERLEGRGRAAVVVEVDLGSTVVDEGGGRDRQAAALDVDRPAQAVVEP